MLAIKVFSGRNGIMVFKHVLLPVIFSRLNFLKELKTIMQDVNHRSIKKLLEPPKLNPTGYGRYLDVSYQRIKISHLND